MKYTIKTQNAKQAKNAGRLLVLAADLDMDVSGYGELGYNNAFGNTYLWLEDYQFILFISDYDDTMKALYSCFVDGKETEFCIDENTDLETLEAWAENLYNESVKKDEYSE